MTADHFALFGLPRGFALDEADLQRRYFALQRALHPDRFAGKSAAEREQAVRRSMQVNEAYDALKAPLLRARHLLALHGLRVGGEGDSVKPSQALLVESMEMRETASDADTAGLDALRAEAALKKRETLEALAAQCGREAWDEAAQSVLRLIYLEKLEGEMRVRRKALPA